MWQKPSVWLLAILSILTVMTPAISLYAIDQYSLDTVEEVIEGGNINSIRTGNYLDIIAYSSYNDIYNLYRTWNIGYVGGAKYEDTYKVRDYPPTQSVKTTNWTVALNHTSYIVVDDYYTVGTIPCLMVLHPLNITTHELAQKDGYLINTTASHGTVGLYIPIAWLDGRVVSGIELTPTTSYAVINNQLKLDILAGLDTRVYVYYRALNYSDTSWDISLEELSVDTGNTFTFTSLQLTAVLLFTILLVSGIFTLFATDTIDIKIDHQTKYLKRRQK